jgi:uncharacterized membrane protein
MMSGENIYFKGYVSILFCAGIFVVLAIPLILRKIPRNVIYGYRTARTLGSDKIWYAANCFFGWCVIVSSAVSAITITILYGTTKLAPTHFMTASILSLAGPLAMAVLFTHLKIRKWENTL